MSNIENNVAESARYIGKMYDNLSYMDQYALSVIAFICITIVMLLIFGYVRMIQVREDLAADWAVQRCNPQNMPFAGWINPPEGVSASEYTRDNFQYCMQNTLTSITGFLTQPLSYIVSSLSSTFEELGGAVEGTRSMMDKMRENIRVFTEEVMGRVLNMVIPLQQVFMAIIDTLQKTNAVMTSGLYTMFGSYLTLQTLLGAILELIIKILIALSAMIMGLWAIPVTWPAAASATAVFLSISIPLAVIITFMSTVMKIHPSMGIPKLHKPKLRCFDKYTPIKMANGSTRYISEINPGDILVDGSVVTACLCLSAAHLSMFEINGTIVSSTHRIMYQGEWIIPARHPNAIPLRMYNKPSVYSLNTSTHQIEVNGEIYLDWDELYGDALGKVMQHIYPSTDVAASLNVGFSNEAFVVVNNGIKAVDSIEIGDSLRGGGFVYGTVRLMDNMFHLLSTTDEFMIAGSNGNSIENVNDYNCLIDDIVMD